MSVSDLSNKVVECGDWYHRSFSGYSYQSLGGFLDKYQPIGAVGACYKRFLPHLQDLPAPPVYNPLHLSALPLKGESTSDWYKRISFITAFDSLTTLNALGQLGNWIQAVYREPEKRRYPDLFTAICNTHRREKKPTAVQQAYPHYQHVPMRQTGKTTYTWFLSGYLHVAKLLAEQTDIHQEFYTPAGSYTFLEDCNYYFGFYRHYDFLLFAFGIPKVKVGELFGALYFGTRQDKPVEAVVVETPAQMYRRMERQARGGTW